MKYSVKKGKDAKGNTWYQYTGTLKDGKTFTGKKYASEQSARGDVSDQRNAHMAKGNLPSVKEKEPKKKKAIGGRSPRMDKMVKKHGPAMRKKGMSQYDISTMARNVVEGGSLEDWKKRYKAEPKPKKRRVVGYEQTSTWSGKASEVQKPTVKRKEIRSFKPKKPVRGILEGQGY